MRSSLCRTIAAGAALAFFAGAPFALAQSGAPQIVLDIDSPSPQSGPYQGLAAFTGWGVGGTAALTSIEAAIDGVPVGVAKYGLNRPDVCVVFPNRPACPSVGWAMTVDTTTLPNGSHTLTLQGFSAAGDSASQSATFTVANWASGNPFITSIDSPNQQNTYSGTVVFGGWAIDTTAAVGSVAIVIDGVAYGNAQYGGLRTDVCAVFPNSKGCPNVGWNFALDTNGLTDGQHTLAVTTTSTSGQNSTVTSTFTVQNLTSSNPIRISIDFPNAGSAPISGRVAFGGWAIDDNSAIVRVATAVDGVPSTNASYGGTRSDVCTIFPGRSGCPRVGWNVVFDTTRYASGAHVFEVTAFGADGQHSTVGTTFKIDNSGTPNPIRISVDQPNPQTSVLAGVARFVGSAIDDRAAIRSVQILIDGTSYGNATYSVSRPDVCTLYPGRPGCPNVGWSMVIDTNRLSNGAHTLYVSATGAEGRNSVISSPFTVANWSSADPMRISIDQPSAQSAALSGVTGIGGWAIDDIGAVTGVSITVDGVKYGSAIYGGARPDVCAAFPNRAGCPNVGWNYGLDTTTLSNGLHSLGVTGTSAGGQQVTVTTPFKVANPITLTVDRPNLASTLFSGLVDFGGWAVDTNDRIGSISVTIDGVAYGNANYGGVRTDVCNIYRTAAGCPNVGWNFGVDTSLLATGLHTLVVTAISAGGQHASSTVPFATNQPNNFLIPGQSAGRVLEQATWGPTAAALLDLKTKGFEAWFTQQVAAPVSTFDDQPLLNALGNTNTNYTPVQTQFFQNALGGADQLRQRVAFALSEMWVVSAVSVNAAQAYPPLMRIFQNRALDNYENLMNDVTLSPAMGGFLNMVNNDKANAARGTSPNENYGRELMQLFTLGLTQINLDGTPVFDENGNSSSTYTELDVESAAKALTGWTYAPQPGASTTGHNGRNLLLPMVPVEAYHDMTAKQLLGTSLSAGRTAEADLTSALHIIFMHPNLPPFVSKQLIQHLVTSNPTPSYVQRVAQVFEDNGRGTRGDMQAVVHAILTDPEARAGDIGQPFDQPSFGHMREPILLVANLLRGLNGTLAATSTVASTAGTLGQSLFYAPSVFSYFSPYYGVQGGLTAPEFQIYSTQSAVNRTGVVNAAIYNGRFDAGTTFNLSAFTAAASNPPTVISLINNVFFHGQMSVNLEDAISGAMAPNTLASDKAKAALYVALTSGEYQIIH